MKEAYVEWCVFIAVYFPRRREDCFIPSAFLRFGSSAQAPVYLIGLFPGMPPWGRSHKLGGPWNISTNHGISGLASPRFQRNWNLRWVWIGHVWLPLWLRWRKLLVRMWLLRSQEWMLHVQTVQISINSEHDPWSTPPSPSPPVPPPASPAPPPPTPPPATPRPPPWAERTLLHLLWLWVVCCRSSLQFLRERHQEGIGPSEQAGTLWWRLGRMR